MRPQAAHMLSYPPTSFVCTMSYVLLFCRAHRRRGLSDRTFFQTDFLMGWGSQKIEYPRAGKANVQLKVHTMARSAWPATKPQTRRDPFRKAYIHLTPAHRYPANQSNPRDQTPKVPHSRTPLGCLRYDTHHDTVPLKRRIPFTKLG